MNQKPVNSTIAATLAALGPLLSGNRTRAYVKDEIPTDLDLRFSDLISGLAGVSVDVRKAIGDKLTGRIAWGLREFAVRMASRAVRTGDPGYVLLGLRALALETDPDDLRDFFVAVGPLYRASELIGARAGPLFDEAAGFTASELSEFIRAFPRRPSDNRRLADFGFREEGAGPTFRFVSTAPSTDDPSVRALLGDLLPKDESEE